MFQNRSIFNSNFTTMCRLLVPGWLGKKRFFRFFFLYLSSELSQTTVQI